MKDLWNKQYRHKKHCQANKIGEKCFDRKTGILAGIIAGLLPSLLLHTTQPLRDSIFIVLMATYVLLLFFVMENPLTFFKGFMFTGIGFILMLALWLVRDSLSPLYLVITGASAALILIRLLKITEKKKFIFNLVCLAMLFMAILFIPKVFHSYLPEKKDVKSHLRWEEFLDSDPHSDQLYLIRKIRYLREAFIADAKANSNAAGSNIDLDVQFSNTMDVIAYLPRAFEIGIFSPFPNYWFDTGNAYGRIGRLLSGGEMLVTYILYIFAIIGIWRIRFSVKPWLLIIIFLSATISMALVFVNIGTLYRMRYFFWILAVILGSGGITFFWQKLQSNKIPLSQIQICCLWNV